MLRSGSDPRHDSTERARARLLRRYARWHRPDDLEDLVLSYRPLALALARRYATGSSTREDLEQAAYEGLIKAIQRFDPDRGVAFASFAVPTILGELRRYLRDTAWPAHIPRSLQERVRDVRSAAHAFRARNGRPATVQDLAIVLECEEEAVDEALQVTSSLSVVSLDGARCDDDRSTPAIAEQLGLDDPGYERVECLAAIERMLPILSNGEKRVLRMHFAEDLTQREIAGRLGVSRSEVARHLASAVTQLRAVAAERRAA